MLQPGLHWLAVLLLLFGVARSAVGATDVDAITWSEPSCLGAKCTTSVQISLNLEHGATTLNRTWTAFKRSSISPTYLLSYPLIVSISSETPYLGVTLTQVDTLYNAFEYFEQDDECHVSKRGACYGDGARPPPVPDGSEQYVLCCMGYAARGNGQHCLRYDYSRAYSAFSIKEMGFLGVVGVNVTSNQNVSTLRLAQRNFIEQKPSVVGFLSWSALYNNPVQSQQRLLFLSGNTSGADDWRNWFWAYKTALPPSIGISADTWKAQATCSQRLNFNTLTHSLPDAADQFAELKQKTLDQVFPIADWSGFSYSSGGAKAMLSVPGIARTNIVLQIDDVEVAAP